LYSFDGFPRYYACILGIFIIKISEMKDLKMITFVMTMLFLGMSCTYAQEKSTVLIKVRVCESMYSINTVKPDYTTYKLEGKGKDENGYVALKRELDKWILEGYVLVNSTVSSSLTSLNDIIYVLIKE
jgi:hypothetical protein